jgi:hypothetical protein
MAWNDRPSASLIYGGVDASGTPGKIEFTAPFATLAGAVLTAGDLLRADLAALTGMSISSMSLNYGRFDDAPPAPVAKSRIENKGTFIFNCSNGLPFRVSIPAIRDTMYNDAGQIFTNDPAVIAFVTALTAVGAVFVNASGGDITSLKAAYQRFGRSTGNMLPSDKLL